MKHAPRGLGAITVIIILVALTSMSAAVLRLGQQAASASQQDVLATRASAAARSGIDWGLYLALKGGWRDCRDEQKTLNLADSDGGEMRVTVSCTQTTYREGETTPGTPREVRIYTLDAVACNSSTPDTPCPDPEAATRAGYVERKRQAHAQN